MASLGYVVGFPLRAIRGFNLFLTAEEEIMLLPVSVCHSDYSKIYERILMKFFGAVGHGSRNNLLDFGGDPNHNPDLGFLDADHDPDPGILKGFLFPTTILRGSKE